MELENDSITLVYKRFESFSKKMIAAGANRIGTSNSVQIIQEALKS